MVRHTSVICQDKERKNMAGRGRKGGRSRADRDLDKAIQLSLEQQNPGSGGLEEAALAGLPDAEDLDYDEQIRLATERSEREERERKRQEKEKEEEAIRKAIEESMQEAKEPEEFTQDDAEAYNKRFQEALRVSRVNEGGEENAGAGGSNSSASAHSTGPGHGKRNRRSRLSDFPEETHPNDLRRIQEDQEFEKALEESKKEEMLRRGGGGTNLPPDNMLPFEALSEEAQLQLALELSKKDVSPLSSGTGSPGLPKSGSETPPALQRSRPVPPDRGSPGPYAAALQQRPIAFGSSTASSSNRMTTVRPDTSSVGRKGQRRPIVIDGCNVGYQYGRNDQFNAKGLQIVYEYFSNKGWENKEIVIFLKQPYMNEESRAICDHLYKIGVLHYTEKRWVGTERIVVDDDENILDYAFEKGGVIISLDQFRDAYEKWPQYHDVIKNRLLQFSFVQNDEFYIAPHPLGPKGPYREEIWKF